MPRGGRGTSSRCGGRGGLGLLAVFCAVRSALVVLGSALMVFGAEVFFSGEGAASAGSMRAASAGAAAREPAGVTAGGAAELSSLPGWSSDERRVGQEW